MKHGIIVSIKEQVISIHRFAGGIRSRSRLGYQNPRESLMKPAKDQGYEW